MRVSKLSLAFAPEYNTAGKRDASAVFQPEARRFLKYHGVPEDRLFFIDNKKSFYSRRCQVMDILEDEIKPVIEQLPVVAFFCHGTTRSIQLGFTTRHVDLFVGALVNYNTSHIRVPLYACNAGADRGSAYRLLIALCEGGMANGIVDGHFRKGHATKNPYVKRYDGMQSPTGGQGGYDIVSPSHKSLWQAWRRALRTDLRFAFPTMTVAQIHEALLQM